jgi:hypothetical protein
MSATASETVAGVCHEAQTHVQTVVPARSVPPECSPRMKPLTSGEVNSTSEDQNTRSFVGGRCMWFTRFGTTCWEKKLSSTSPTTPPRGVERVWPAFAGTRTTTVLVTDGWPRRTCQRVLPV